MLLTYFGIKGPRCAQGTRGQRRLIYIRQWRDSLKPLSNYRQAQGKARALMLCDFRDTLAQKLTIIKLTQQDVLS